MKKRRMSAPRREALTGILFVSPAVLGTLVFFLFPFCESLSLSLLDNISQRHFVGFENYLELFGNATFQRAVSNTLLFMLAAVITLNLAAFLISLFLEKLSGAARDTFRAVYTLPLVLPVVSVVLFFQVCFHENGVISQFLQFFGKQKIDFFHSGWAFLVLVLLYVWKNCGYNIILFLAMLESIPKDYYEEADLEGANWLQRAGYVTFPLSVPYLFFILIISVVNSFKSFREAYILFGNYPDRSVYMIQHFINNNFSNLDYVRISSSSSLLFFLIFALTFVLFRMQKKWQDER